jgi:hypothetical protein
MTDIKYRVYYLVNVITYTKLQEVEIDTEGMSFEDVVEYCRANLSTMLEFTVIPVFKAI